MSKGKPPKQRPPAEKKALSYARDCRNDYGENDKASRKSIPRRKAIEHRIERHAVKQDMQGLPLMDEVQQDVVESTARQDLRRVGGWTKSPDQPLGKFLPLQARLRARRAGET